MKRIKSLKERWVLITGAAGGIGTVLTRQVLQEGARVILVDKNFERLTELKDELATETVQIFEADLARKESLFGFCDKIEDQDVDVLVNNAGVVYSGSFEHMDLEDFEQVQSINLYAAVRLTRRLLPKLIARRGHIVNVASGAGLMAPGGLCAYATSKYGLVGYSEALRAELHGRVGVSAICPYFVKTQIVKNSLLGSNIAAEDRDEHLAKLDQMVQMVGTKTARVGKVIIKSIKKNKGLVPVGFNTRLLWAIAKYFPRFANYLNNLVYRKLGERGYIK